MFGFFVVILLGGSVAAVVFVDVVVIDDGRGVDSGGPYVVVGACSLFERSVDEG